MKKRYKVMVPDWSARLAVEYMVTGAGLADGGRTALMRYEAGAVTFDSGNEAFVSAFRVYLSNYGWEIQAGPWYGLEYLGQDGEWHRVSDYWYPQAECDQVIAGLLGGAFAGKRIRTVPFDGVPCEVGI